MRGSGGISLSYVMHAYLLSWQLGVDLVKPLARGSFGGNPACPAPMAAPLWAATAGQCELRYRCMLGLSQIDCSAVLLLPRPWWGWAATAGQCGLCCRCILGLSQIDCSVVLLSLVGLPKPHPCRLGLVHSSALVGFPKCLCFPKRSNSSSIFMRLSLFVAQKRWI